MIVDNPDCSAGPRKDEVAICQQCPLENLSCGEWTLAHGCKCPTAETYNDAIAHAKAKGQGGE